MDVTSVPLAFFAGMLSILSPCIWPLVPVVMSSAATTGRSGPWFLALGLSLSFAFVGTVITFVLLNLGMDPVFFRYFAAAMLLLVAVVLLVPTAAERFSAGLSRLTSRFDAGGAAASTGPGQFGVGALLGVVWLPCVGPTLGAAIAMASAGQNMGLAALVMFAFGIGTTSVLIAAGLASNKALAKWRPGIMGSAETGKKVLGWTLLFLGVLVLTGFDKVLEEIAIQYLPNWAHQI